MQTWEEKARHDHDYREILICVSSEWCFEVGNMLLTIDESPWSHSGLSVLWSIGILIFHNTRSYLYSYYYEKSTVGSKFIVVAFMQANYWALRPIIHLQLVSQKPWCMHEVFFANFDVLYGMVNINKKIGGQDSKFMAIEV